MKEKDILQLCRAKLIKTYITFQDIKQRRKLQTAFYFKIEISVYHTNLITKMAFRHTCITSKGSYFYIVEQIGSICVVRRF